jgi:hypothetical protein
MPNKINTVGRHAAIVQAAEFGETEKGTPYLCLTFAGDASTTEGTQYGYLYLSEKALANSVKTLRDAFGFDGNFETVVEQIVEKPCAITNESEEYEGKERVKVKWINAPRSSKPIENQSAFLKALSAKAARIPAKAPSAGQAPTRAPATNRPAATPARNVNAPATATTPF